MPHARTQASKERDRVNFVGDVSDETPQLQVGFLWFPCTWGFLGPIPKQIYIILPRDACGSKKNHQKASPLATRARKCVNSMRGSFGNDNDHAVI